MKPFSIVLLVLVMTSYLVWAIGAQGVQPEKFGGPGRGFLEASPSPPPPPPDSGPAFRRAAEEALRRYLEVNGPANSLARLRLDARGQVLSADEAPVTPPPPLDVASARAAAQARIRITWEQGAAPLWDRATLADPIPLYDLTGEIVAYLFAVHQNGTPAGYLTVAALDLPNPVLEFATDGPSPLDGALDALRQKGLRSLHPDRPLYLGLLGYAYEVPSPTVGTRRIFRLLDHQSLEISETDARVPLREHVRPQPIRPLSAQPMAYRLISSVPDWNQFWGSYGCWSGCSPTAATNVMGYWDSHGYGNLISGSDWQAAVNEMRTYMGTYCGQDGSGWTSVGNISPGISTYSQAHGYTFASELWCDGCATYPSYDRYRSEIDANRPMVVDVSGHSTYGDHSVTGVGYETSGFYLIVHDNWPSTGENVYLQYGSGYSTIFMHPVIPGGGGSNRPPNTPQPTGPGDWYVARDGRAPTLCWQNNGDPDGDAVQFFAEVFESAVNAQSGWINDTCWRPATLDGHYYGYQWRVKARDSRGAESGWSAVWHFTIEQPPQPPDTPWQAQYWDNIELRGTPRVNTTESGIYFVRHWGWGNGPHGLPADYWSGRFVKTAYFPGGYYRFHCHKDDACRLYIDGQLRIDQWWDSSFEGGDWSGNLPAGNHEIKVEYYEKTGYAALEVWWQGPSYLPYDEDCDQNNAWCAEYYLNREVLGTAAVRRSEGSSLWFDWGTGGPASTFPTDNFSTRFRRNAHFTCGTYRFHLFTDDGVRFWVDDVQRLDEWRDQVASFSVDVDLSTGVHNLRVEHYEGGGSAALHFWWETLADCAPSVAVDYASTHYVRPGSAVDPAIRVRVTGGYLDGGRGDHLAFVGGGAMGAASTQPIYGLVDEGSAYTFDVANSSNFRMTAPLTEGTYDSLWRVKANGNLIGPEATVRVVVDNTPPSVGIQNPAEGAYLNGNTVTVQASPQDTNGIDQVQFFVGYNDGSGWAWYNLGWDLDGSDGWNQAWDASGVPDQPGIAFYAYAWDLAGNGAGAAAWDVTLDRTPPTTAIRPLAATQDSTAFIVWWDAGDNVAGVDYLDLQKQQDGGAWEDWHLGVGSQYAGAWFIGEMGQRYGFRMRGTDRAGNVEGYPSGAEAETYINPCWGDAYEADDGPSQARTIGPGQSQSHNFCGVGDEDWLKFQAQRGQRYVVETADLGFTTDTVLTLYDADGTTVLAENDDIAYPENLASRVEWIALRDGWLYVRVHHWDGRIAGNGVTYTIRLEKGYRVYLPLVLHNQP